MKEQDRHTHVCPDICTSHNTTKPWLCRRSNCRECVVPFGKIQPVPNTTPPVGDQLTSTKLALSPASGPPAPPGCSPPPAPLAWQAYPHNWAASLGSGVFSPQPPQHFGAWPALIGAGLLELTACQDAGAGDILCAWHILCVRFAFAAPIRHKARAASILQGVGKAINKKSVTV
eukprot:scaffold159542_cov20-Tisochrysis_lutea.AAC.2